MIKNQIESQEISLYDLANWQNGLAFKNITFSSSGLPIIKIAELKNGITDQTKFTQYKFEKNVFLTKGDMLFSWSGNPETSIDTFIYNLPDGWLNQHIFKVTPKNIDSKYFYYVMKSLNPVFKRIASNKQTTGLGHVTVKDLKEIKIFIPSHEEQQHIVNILGSIDDKIENNEKKCTILENLLLNNFLTLKHVMINCTTVKLNDYFEISIGRTPPRKESRWFEDNKNDKNIKWISISDMGSIKTFIFHTSECLTNEAVRKFNIPIIPKKTVILSFKLTVGRVAITSEQMTSNEAIAHFKTENKIILPFLYAYLKCYDFNRLGSTSSIALATNSKSIKNIDFIMPTEKELKNFYDINQPILDKILSLQKQIIKLNELKQLYLKKFFG